MAKGIFTQGIAILLSSEVSLDTVADLLAYYDIRARIDSYGDINFGSETLVVSYRPEVNGVVAIDQYPAPWPDGMGDPNGDSSLFTTWAMGHFGPFTFPDALRRGVQQSWRWSEAGETVSQHATCLRLRLSYTLGAGEDAPSLPMDYQPSAELLFLTRLAGEFERLPEALAYFNPNGEVLSSLPALNASLLDHERDELPPLSLWSNIRLYGITPEWSLMDSVGNAQLDLPDLEVGFPEQLTSPEVVDRFIRNVTLYLLEKGLVIEEGDTMDSPDGIRWRATRSETSLSMPTRPVLRWLPAEVEEIPEYFLRKE